VQVLYWQLLLLLHLLLLLLGYVLPLLLLALQVLHLQLLLLLVCLACRHVHVSAPMTPRRHHRRWLSHPRHPLSCPWCCQLTRMMTQHATRPAVNAAAAAAAAAGRPHDIQLLLLLLWCLARYMLPLLPAGCQQLPQSPHVLLMQQPHQLQLQLLLAEWRYLAPHLGQPVALQAAHMCQLLHNQHPATTHCLDLLLLLLMVQLQMPQSPA
jgi:hypothetical protein